MKKQIENIPVSAKNVAVIMAALTAAGLLAPGEKINSIKRQCKQNPWKRSGLLKLMLNRDFSIPE